MSNNWALHTSNFLPEANSAEGVHVPQIPSASVVISPTSAAKSQALQLQQLRDAARQSQFRMLYSPF
jgi:hypothetical protein